MSRSRRVLGALCVCLGTIQVLAAGQKPHIAGQKPHKITPAAGPIVPLLATVGTVSASPATISFTATDPDLGSVSGSAASTVSWTTASGSTTSTWTLQVQAAAASFTSCGTVPTSAVTATCGSVTGGSSGACKPAITVSTTAQQVATGKESTSLNAPYSVTLNFKLADSWKYIAKSSCTLILTYTVTAP
jgi:hypothetical protein